jgi:KaiC/GvpD/RAD55 family RecA-like ATPase
MPLDENQKLTPHIQDCIVKLSIENDDFIRISRFDIKDSYFDSDIARDMIKVCFAFFDRFNEAPKNHFIEKLSEFTADKKDEELRFYAKYYRKIVAIDSVNYGYIISELSQFIRSREFAIAGLKFIELIEEDRIDEAEHLMYTALKSGITEHEEGIWYLEKEIPSYLTEAWIDPLFGSGVSELDKYIGGYRRTQFICFLGDKKGKKTWALIHTGKQALLNNLNVVHFTHEVSKQEVEMRYDMAFSSFTSEDNIIEVPYATFDEEGVLIETSYKKRPSVKSGDAITKVRKRIKNKLGRLIIKKYPPLVCTLSEIDRFLDYLEIYHDFIPDLFINDYVDIMAPADPKLSTRDNLNIMYLAHKRIADQRNCVVATVSQSTSDASRKGRLRFKDFSEDKRKAGNVDMAIGIIETDDEIEAGIARLYVIANRSGRMDVGCGISTNVLVGQFAIQSWPLRKEEHEDEEE